MELERPADAPWVAVRDELRSRGLRWTPQRRLILDVLAATSGHVTGSEIVDRCRARDAETTPSTVYRTLDVLEELGYLSHSHGPDGREEFHVLPEHEHAHLQCVRCGASTELAPEDARRFVAELERSTGFRVDIGHLTVAGTCSGLWRIGVRGSPRRGYDRRRADSGCPRGPGRPEGCEMKQRRALPIIIVVVVVVAVIAFVATRGNSSSSTASADAANTSIMITNVQTQFANEVWYPSLLQSSVGPNVQVVGTSVLVFTSLANTTLSQATAATICSSVAGATTDPATGQPIGVTFVNVFGSPNQSLATCNVPATASPAAS